MPSPIDADVLARAGVSPSLIPRTLQSLQSLDLIREDGTHTDVLEGLRLAPEADFKKRMAEWLTATYADALSYIDPATDDEIRIRDAFRSYNPVGQQGRMVSLFMGLFTAAGVMAERPKAVPARKPSATAPIVRPRVLATAAVRGPARAFASGGGGPPQTALPPALAGLLHSLPRQGEGWTQDRRDKFVTTFGAVVDFCFPIVKAQLASTETAADQ
jgi:hypothetical protein